MTTLVTVLSVVAAGVVAWLLWLLFWSGRRITNILRGWFLGIPIREARAASRVILPPPLRTFKLVRNLTRTPAGSGWQENVESGVGDYLRWRLDWQNSGYTPTRADEVRGTDNLHGDATLVAGSGLLNIGRDGEDIPISDEQLARLFGGDASLSDFGVTEIPARNSVYIRYTTRVTNRTRFAAGATVGPTADTTPTPPTPAPPAPSTPTLEPIPPVPDD